MSERDLLPAGVSRALLVELASGVAPPAKAAAAAYPLAAALLGVYDALDGLQASAAVLPPEWAARWYAAEDELVARPPRGA